MSWAFPFNYEAIALNFSNWKTDTKVTRGYFGVGVGLTTVCLIFQDDSFFVLVCSEAMAQIPFLFILRGTTQEIMGHSYFTPLLRVTQTRVIYYIFYSLT